MRESYIEKELARRVRDEGGWALKLPATFVAGLPDRLVLWPGGRAEFVEVKAPGKKPRKIQQAIHIKLVNLGFEVFTIDTTEGAKRYAIDRRTTS